MKYLQLSQLRLSRSFAICLLGLFVLISTPGHLFADSPGHTPPKELPPEPDDPCPASDPCKQFMDWVEDNGCGEGEAGDPIRIHSGEFYLARTYLKQSNGSFPMDFRMRYSSFSDRYSVAGYGWAHNFNMRLYEDEMNRLIVRDDLGKRRTFESLAGSVYQSNDYQLDKITILADGSYLMVREEDGFTYRFDPEGRLSVITNAMGGEWRFSYELQTTAVAVVPIRSNVETALPVLRDWRLSNVAEYRENLATGRFFSLFYSQSGLLEKVTKQGGMQIELFYDEGHAKAHGLLTSIVAPENSKDIFTYWLVEAERYKRKYGLVRTFTNTGCGSCAIRENNYDATGRVLTQFQGGNREGEDIAFNYSNFERLVDPYVEVTHKIKLVTENSAGGYTGSQIDTRQERVYFSINSFTGKKRIKAKVTKRGAGWDAWSPSLPKDSIVDDTVTSYDSYDAATGKLIFKTEPNGSTKEIIYTYHPGTSIKSSKTRVHTIAEGVTKTSVWTYDSLERLTKEEFFQSDRPNEAFAVSYSYWGSTRLVNESSKLLSDGSVGSTTISKYYNIGTGPAGLSEHSGLLAEKIDPDNHVTTYDYSTVTVDSSGAVTGLGGLLEAENRYDEDDLNNPVSSRTMQHDLRGRLTYRANSDGTIERMEYDNRDRMILLQYFDVDDVLVSETHYTFLGPNLVEQRVGSPVEGYRAVRFNYDSLNNRVATYRHAGQLASSDAVASSQNWEMNSTRVFDNQGWVRLAGNALGQSTTFDYEPQGWLLEQVTPVQNSLSATTVKVYDRGGRVTTNTGNLGAVTSYFYDGLDRVLLIQESVDGGGTVYRTTRSDYNAVGDVTKLSYYEGDLNLEADPAPAAFAVTNYYYDELARLVGINWNPENDDKSGDLQLPRKYSYNERDQLNGFTDGRGNSTQYEIDALGRVVRATFADNSFTLKGFDERRNLVWSQDERGIRTYSHFDSANRLTHRSIETDSTGWIGEQWWTLPERVQTEVTSFNAWGQPLSILDVDRNESGLTYDSYGRLDDLSSVQKPTIDIVYTALDQQEKLLFEASLASPASEIAYGYSAENGLLLTSVTDRGGNKNSTTYNEGMKVATVTNSLNQVSEDATILNYDALGRLVSEVDEAGNRSGYSYDVLNRQNFMYSPDHPFDASGLPQPSVQVGRQSVVFSQYNQVEEISGAGSHALKYIYDLSGNLTHQIDAKGGGFASGTTTQWTYNSRNRLSTKTYNASANPPGDSVVYSYEANGLLKSRLDGKNQLTQYNYLSDRNLMTKVDYPTDVDVVFGVEVAGEVSGGYDKAGRLLRMEDSSGLTTWSYDSYGRQQYYQQHSTGYQLHSQYDERSRLSDLRLRDITAALPADDPNEWHLEYQFDASDRLQQILDSAEAATPISYQWHANANLVERISFPNGIYQHKDYDNLGRLTKIRAAEVSGNTDLSRYEYGINTLSQRETVQHLDGGVITFDYDQERQVNTAVKSDEPIFNFDYDFDEIGNRTQTVSNGSTSVSVPNPLNQYDTVSSTSLAYDDNGSLTGNGDVSYVWDEENRIKAVLLSLSDIRIEYIYDGIGRRVERREFATVDGVTPVEVTRYLFNGWNCVAEYRQNGGSGAFTETARYVWGLDMSNTGQGAGGVGGLLRYTNSETNESFYPAYDGNGNVSDYFDEFGALSAHFEYDPFGDVVLGSVGDPNQFPFLFSTKSREVHTGLYYYGHRFYDPVVGGWLSRDPLQEEGGANVYGFVGNNAVDYYDVNGLHPANMSMGKANALLWGGLAAMGALGGVGEQAIDDLAQEAGANHVAEKNGCDRDDLLPPYDWGEVPGKYGQAAAVGAALGVVTGGVVKGGGGLFKALGNSIKGKFDDFGRILCFVPETEVLMADGATKKIEDIEVGDEVAVLDPQDDSEWSSSEVTALIQSYTHHVVSLRFKAGESHGLIDTTGNHPFWINGDGWKYAREIRVGDELLDCERNPVSVVSVEVNDVESPAFNLDVGGPSAYFVVSQGVSILVHNQDLINPNLVQFSQDVYSPVFSDGRPFQGLVDHLKGGGIVDEPIRIVPLERLPKNVQDHLVGQGALEGDLFSLDNRRLAAAQLADKDISYREATDAEIRKAVKARKLGGKFRPFGKFSTENAGRTICPK